MVTKTMSPPPTQIEQIEQTELPVQTPAISLPSPNLPTFDWETGYKEIYNPQTDQYDRYPLILLDLLYPQEEQEGVIVVVTQNFYHDLWTAWLKVMLQNFLGNNWLVTHDVLMKWGHTPGKSPDIAAFPNTSMPPAKQKSYRIGLDGPPPAFVLEILSDTTRHEDLHGKQLHYAALGINEYLIIDLSPTEPWQLRGYRLIEDSPLYRAFPSDAAGGLTFFSLGLRFLAVGQERIEVYNAETGELLLRPDELNLFAKAEAARADTEAKARAKAEHRIAELEARLYDSQTKDK